MLDLTSYANLYRLPSSFAEDGRGPSGISRGKSIGLTEGILLPAEAVDSNRSRPTFGATVRDSDRLCVTTQKVRTHSGKARARYCCVDLLELQTCNQGNGVMNCRL